MSNEELNKWLAEFMGWHLGYSNNPDEHLLWWKDKDNKSIILNLAWKPTEDRNQMAMCEEKIPKDKQVKYATKLLSMTLPEYTNGNPVGIYPAITANALQRAEAIRKTMEG